MSIAIPETSETRTAQNDEITHLIIQRHQRRMQGLAPVQNLSLNLGIDVGGSIGGGSGGIGC